MTTTKSHYACAELAALRLPNYPTTRQGFEDIVKREKWPFIETRSRGRGGIRREYQPPAALAREIANHQSMILDGAAASQVKAIKAAVHHEAESDRLHKQEVAINEILAQLTPAGREKFDATLDILLDWRDWCGEQRQAGTWAGKEEAKRRFCEAYAAGDIKVSGQVRAAIKKFSPRTLERMLAKKEKDGLSAIVDGRNIKDKPGCKQSIFELNRPLEQAFIAFLTEKPHIKNTDLFDLLNHVRVVKETGEALWPKVGYDAICNYRKAFEAKNRQALMSVTAPASYKNKCMTAYGNLSGGVTRLNQRWEFDGTPADWLFIDGRHTASVVIDVWSRRPMIRFSKTPRTETNKQLLRDALLAWGVPERADTDRGSDYMSKEFRLALEMLDVPHNPADAFSPWQKGHVERFIKTYVSSVLELLDNFEGRNVAEKKVINDRRTFAEQLFKKNEVVKVDMTVEEFQVLTNAWIDGTYMHTKHDGIGMTPFEKVTSWGGTDRKISNVRALDILLFKPVGRPVVGKKGIRYDNAYFIHPELGLHTGHPVEIFLDPNDIGRLYVHRDGEFLFVAECPERTGVSQSEIATSARAVQSKAVAEKKEEWKKARRAQPMTTAELVKDLLMHRAEKAGKLAHIRRDEEYSTPAIVEAEKASRALDTPVASTESDELSAEARQILAGVLNPKAPVIDLASHRQTLPALLDCEENPVPGFGVAEKYDAWHALDARAKAGNKLPHGWQRQFHALYPGTPDFQAEQAMRSHRHEKHEGV